LRELEQDISIGWRVEQVRDLSFRAHTHTSIAATLLTQPSRLLIVHVQPGLDIGILTSVLVAPDKVRLANTCTLRERL
jgi:hypothetical protein